MQTYLHGDFRACSKSESDSSPPPLLPVWRINLSSLALCCSLRRGWAAAACWDLFVWSWRLLGGLWKAAAFLCRILPSASWRLHILSFACLPASCASARLLRTNNAQIMQNYAQIMHKIATNYANSTQLTHKLHLDYATITNKLRNHFQKLRKITKNHASYAASYGSWN